MLREGTTAPSFELPALVDGERQRVALEEYVGEDVIVLAFYPADFNPACDVESDLDELDLFTMQKDVTVLGISPDSLYSHRAFADEYDLHVPLLSDTNHEVAEQYGVAFEDEVGQQLAERAVFVVDHDGEIAYAWSTSDMETLPNVEEIKDAIADTGGDDTAFARYRVGHAHYVEGRRAFTSAMGAFGDSEWMMAQGDFQRAREEFAEAEEQFDSAVRFCDDEDVEAVYRRAKEKTNALWQAADWLSDAASAYSSGSGAKGEELRSDAERPLETARDLGEPPDPDDEWPPELDDTERDHERIVPTEDRDSDATLAVDIDEEVAEQQASDGDAAADGDDAATGEDAVTGDDAATDEGDGDEIDDEELAEIEAELATDQPDETSTQEEQEDLEERTSIVDAPPTTGGTDAEDAPGDGRRSDSDDAAPADTGADRPGATDSADDTGGGDTDDDGEGEREQSPDDRADDAEGEIELDLADPTADDTGDESSTGSGDRDGTDREDDATADGPPDDDAGGASDGEKAVSEDRAE